MDVAVIQSNNFNFDKTLSSFKSILEKGGPNPEDYKPLLKITDDLMHASLTLEDEAKLYDLLKPLLTMDCLIGCSYLKPYGYTGDFEIIDKMYQYWKSPKTDKLHKWDSFFHSFHSVRAVRNRKDYFVRQASRLLKNKNDLKILDLASGPCTDVYEFFKKNPFHDATVDCLDMDKNAIEYASTICDAYIDSIKFINKNALRYRTDKKYDFIWSAGLFDYFNDKLFKNLLKNMYQLLNPGGELIVGNFADYNPSKGVMEILGKWYMHHRSEDDLINLAIKIGIPEENISVGCEETKVNLFLHIKK